MNELITIYILNRNYSTFLEQSIKSALEQTYKKLDIIIIDDASNDNSINILNKFQNNNKIRIIINKKNIGLQKSSNIAIKAAKGKYIIRLDADDIMHKQCVEQLYKAIIKQKNIALVYPNYFIIDEVGYTIFKNKEIDIKKNKYREPILAACCLIKISSLYEVGLYDERYTRQDGYDIWYKLIKYYKIIHLNKYLFYYRKHNKNLTTNKSYLFKTRSSIMYNFTKKEIKKNIINVAIICRDKNVENIDVFKKIKNKTFLDHAIKDVFNCKFKKKIFLITESERIIKKIKKKYQKKIIAVKRNFKDAQLNTNFRFYLINLFRNKCDILIIIQPNYYFERTHYIEQGLSKLLINKLDKVITTIVEDLNDNFYKLKNNGIQIISNDNEKKIKLEKNLIFRQVGGITIYNYKNYKKNKISNVGNVIVNKNEIISLVK